MSLNLKRPKRINEEDEDDLLRFQEEFLKNKSNQQPAAKVIRKTNADDSKKLGDNLIEPTNDENNLIHSKRIEIDCNFKRLNFLKLIQMTKLRH